MYGGGGYKENANTNRRTDFFSPQPTPRDFSRNFEHFGRRNVRNRREKKERRVLVRSNCEEMIRSSVHVHTPANVGLHHSAVDLI